MSIFPSIRSRLIAVVVLTTVPPIIALGLLAYLLFANQKTQVEIDMIQTTRALAAAVDRDFMVGLSVARALAASPTLQSGNMQAFHAEARSVLGAPFPGFTIVLSDLTGQQLVNTLRPPGEPLPKHGNIDLLKRVAASGQPLLSDIYIGGVTGKPVVTVEVPVWRAGKVAYVLSVGYLPQSLVRLLANQNLPEGRMAAVFDSQGVIAARTHLHDQLVGKKGIPELVERMAKDTHGIVESRTLEGLTVIIAFTRSTETGWSVGISTPWTVVLTETLGTLALLYGTVGLLLLAGVAAAWMIGGQIGRSVRDLTAPALALGSGDPVVALDRGPAEAVEVGRALKAVESELNRYRHDLESLVAERTEALEASNRELERFAYVASHDLQEPLRMVVSYVDLLSRRHGDRLDDEAREFIGFAREGAFRMSNLIKDLLEYSRIGQHDRVNVAIDLGQVVREALENLQALTTETDGKVRIVGQLPVLSGNPVELIRVFQNLIGNALKYRAPDVAPRVTIEAEPGDGEWIIRVADNGIGIDPQYRETIFGLFQRLHARHEFQGTGIGLTSAKKIVELHGGRIWVEDGPGGVGSTFCVALPD
ncbi:putative Sensor histidine kinase [Magnetospirillum sp. UT-4]|nr:putative Sensor histidine kinase [Magnetospirillum sp. UT-4]